MKHFHLKPTFLLLLTVMMAGGLALLLNIETAVSSPAQTSTFSGNNDLLAYWTANEGSGTTLTDNSGNGYDITLSASDQSYTTAVPTVNFDNPSALSFDNSSSLSASTGSEIDDLQELTLAVWAKPSSTPSGAGRFITLSNEKASLQHRNGDDFRFSVTIDGIQTTLTVNNVVSAGSYNHYAGTYDGSTMRIYVNGALVSNTTVNGTVDTGGVVNNFAYGNSAVINSIGYNIDDLSNSRLTATGDLTATDPLLNALADNGGDTLTHALQSNSPALDQIPSSTNECGTTYTTDQRGEARPDDDACDMGAYEYIYDCTASPLLVSSEFTLNKAIACYNDALSGSVTISLTTNILLSAASTSMNNSGSASLFVAGNDYSIDGNNAYRVVEIQDGDIILSNIILTNGSGNQGGFAYGNSAVINSIGYNIDDLSNSRLTGTGDLTATDPLLNALADNGGDTLTHALQSNSPALDQIPNGTNGCGTTYTTDQRGDVRPYRSNCDSGAYEAVQYELNTAVSGTGIGTISSSPSGIDCEADCDEWFVEETAVTLTANVDTGSTFTGWTGACNGTSNCALTITETTNVTATFALNSYDLAVAVDGTGGGSVDSEPVGIDCGVDCSESFDYGTAVTLTATYDTNSTAVIWGGACATAVGDSCNLTITETKHVTSTFTLGSFALGVIMDGNGSGSVTSDPVGIECQEDGGSCNAAFTATQTVTLTAVADIGSTFTGWSGICSGVGDCLVTMDESKSVTALFALNSYSMSVNSSGDGQGTITSNPAGIDCGITCNADFDYGTVVTLTAVADSGSTFTGWSGICSGVDDCVVTMGESKSVTALFEADEYLIYLPMIVSP